jgi:predicted adenine nucleotide alpha hydrolase (AANH) superfamily ATPase
MNKAVLLHICCGPCSIYPVSILRNHGYEVTGHFYNPNIHPYKEFRKRLTTFEEFASKSNIPLIVDKKYGLTDFLQKVVFSENKRCALCYDDRLKTVAKTAADKGFDSFSTTLLYSRYQNHKSIVDIAEKYADLYGVSFTYHDFRAGWQEGIDKSIEAGMYRQPYCGCIYSEQERYDKSLRKK